MNDKGNEMLIIFDSDAMAQNSCEEYYSYEKSEEALSNIIQAECNDFDEIRIDFFGMALINSEISRHSFIGRNIVETNLDAYLIFENEIPQKNLDEFIRKLESIYTYYDSWVRTNLHEE
jgi:hypothetical protein